MHPAAIERAEGQLSTEQRPFASICSNAGPLLHSSHSFPRLRLPLSGMGSCHSISYYLAGRGSAIS